MNYFMITCNYAMSIIQQKSCMAQRNAKYLYLPMFSDIAKHEAIVYLRRLKNITKG